MILSAYLGNDKENWGQLLGLVKRIDADKIILVQDSKISGFPLSKKCEIIKVDGTQPLLNLKKEIMDKIKIILSGEFEVALSLASGNGKEHMALISALLSVPVGIRLVAFTNKGVEFIN